MKNWKESISSTLNSIFADWKSEKEEKLRVDKATFNKIIKLFSQEEIRIFIDDVFNGYYRRHFLKKLDEYERLYKEPTSSFLDKKIESARVDFNSAFGNLLGFLTRHFFSHYSNLDIFALYPELKNSPNGKDRNLFDRWLKELREILDNFEDKYNNFLKITKMRLVKHNRFDTPWKKIFIALIILLVLSIGIGIGRGLKQEPQNLPSDEVENAGSVSQNQAKQESETKTTDEITGDLIKVTRAIDGDTIEIEGGEKVRYIGIDTPETVDPRKPIQCFGVEASKKNKELVEGKTVRLEKDITDRDKYNRLLRYIWVGDTFINLELVKQGFAYSYSYPPDIKYQEQFVKAQQEAREAKRGLWSSCQSDSRVSGASTSVSSDTSPTGDCVIKGSISSTGEKIYHLPGCGSYSKTQIDESRGEKWFCSESKAQAAGWRRALNCP